MVSQTSTKSLETVSASIGVDGMHCRSCAGRVERSLTEIPGVLAVSVDIPGKRVDVRFDPPATTAGLSQAIEQAGYKTIGAASLTVAEGVER